MVDDKKTTMPLDPGIIGVAVATLALLFILGWVAAVSFIVMLIIFWLPYYLFFRKSGFDELERIFLPFFVGLLAVSLSVFYLNLLVGSLRLAIFIVLPLSLVVGFLPWSRWIKGKKVSKLKENQKH